MIQSDGSVEQDEVHGGDGGLRQVPPHRRGLRHRVHHHLHRGPGHRFVISQYVDFLMVEFLHLFYKRKILEFGAFNCSDIFLCTNFKIKAKPFEN